MRLCTDAVILCPLILDNVRFGALRRNGTLSVIDGEG